MQIRSAAGKDVSRESRRAAAKARKAKRAVTLTLNFASDSKDEKIETRSFII
jgi:hypothetical protein